MYFRLGDLYKEYNQFEEARLYLEKAQTIYDFLIQKGLVDEFTKESAELVDRVLVILDATIKRNKETFGWDGEKLNPVKLWGTKGTFDEPSSELEQNALMGDPKAIFDLSISKDKKWEEREKSIKWMMYGGDLGYYLHYCRAAYSIIQEEELNRREFGPGASLHAIEKLDKIHIKLLAGFEKIKDEKMSKTAEGAICSVERELCINYLLMSGCCPKKYKENTVKMSLEMIRKCVSKFNSLNEGNFYEFYWYCIALLKMYIVNKEFVFFSTRGER